MTRAAARAVVEGVLLALASEGRAHVRGQGPHGTTFEADVGTVLGSLARLGALEPWPEVRDALREAGVVGESFG